MVVFAGALVTLAYSFPRGRYMRHGRAQSMFQQFHLPF